MGTELSASGTIYSLVVTTKESCQVPSCATETENEGFWTAANLESWSHAVGAYTIKPEGAVEQGQGSNLAVLTDRGTAH